MSRTDLNAIPRIIEACEGAGDVHARVQAAQETINHLMGATQHLQYVGYSGSDLVIPPLVVARMLRAARGEHVELGRLLFLGAPSLKEQANEIADAARKLMDLCRAGSGLRQQVEASLAVNAERRHQLAVLAEEIRGGNIDEAQVHLADLLARWEE